MCIRDSSDSVTLPEVDTVYAEPEKKAEEEKPETTESAEKDLPEPGVPRISPFGFFKRFRSTMIML